MDSFLIKAAQLILAFAILVIIHEFGHFLFARLFGVRVEKFYIFFDPWTELFRWKPKKYIGGLGKTRRFGKTSTENMPDADDSYDEKENKKFWSGTEYGVGWLPLGGYCKISGMIDESMDKEQMAQPAKPWEFRSKPAWQRLLIMVAGVLFNFLLAILIYAGIVYATGEKYVPLRNAEMGMEYSGEAHKIGFHNGDIPIRADGKDLPERPDEARMAMIQASDVDVLRGGDTVRINIPEKFIFSLDRESKSDTAMFNFMTYRLPVRVSQVANGESADKAGVRKGDIIVSVNGMSTSSLTDFFHIVRNFGSKTVNLGIVRPEAPADTITLPVTLSENAKMGVGLEIDPSEFYKSEEIRYNIFQAVPRGISMGVDKLTSYVRSMKLVFTKEGAQSIGGFGAIGSIFPEKWNWIAFWNIAAFLSVALAFMNILPIPALDGGHVMFLLYEVITRRKPGEKFMEWAQMIGMGLLILLLLYANGMDIVRLFR